MDPQAQNRLAMQIVIGSAWVDQHLEPEEVVYLQKLLRRYHLQADSELTALLEQSVPLPKIEAWIVEYLRETNDDVERLQLLANIGNLLIADDVVSESEHQLLDDYHTLMAQIPTHADVDPRDLVTSIGRGVRALLRSLGKLMSGKT